MADTASGGTKDLAHGSGLEPAAPLWKRVPRSDENGRPLGDFMMILPALRRRRNHVAEAIRRIEAVLGEYADAVVFADFNTRLNVLWVLVRQRPGICIELPAAINAAVPEALLVAHPRFI